MRAARRRPALATLVGVALLATACARSNPTYRVDRPSFRSAAPGAQDELQMVLDSQAESIVVGDWRGLFEMFVPTERARCNFDLFVQSASDAFGTLRDRAAGSFITAEMSDVEVSGFRASVDYRFVLPVQGLASTSQTSHYLKLGDRWFIDEKAC